MLAKAFLYFFWLSSNVRGGCQPSLRQKLPIPRSYSLSTRKSPKSEVLQSLRQHLVLLPHLSNLPAQVLELLIVVGVTQVVVLLRGGCGVVEGSCGGLAACVAAVLLMRRTHEHCRWRLYL